MASCCTSAWGRFCTTTGASMTFFSKCSIDFEPEPSLGTIKAVCTVKVEGKTGVEMEALHGVSAALLTIYDMCKAIDKRMVIKEIHLVEKHGGKSGDFYYD